MMNFGLEPVVRKLSIAVKLFNHSPAAGFPPRERKLP